METEVKHIEVNKDKIIVLEIKIKRLKQLFNSFDPSPFNDKDLDDKAVDYISSSVKEHTLKTKMKLVIYVPRRELRRNLENDTKEGIKNFFSYTMELEGKKINATLKEGQRSLIIGTLFLLSCLLIREVILMKMGSWLTNIMTEGLLIGGWVAMWKPISNILYDWWPMQRNRRIYKKISEMEIEFIAM